MPVVQCLLAAAACLGLWRLCRAQPKIVVAGFLVRAFTAQVLFWISYLQLPIARSLQLGRGFWFFAVDGPFYMRYANTLAARGPVAILLDADFYPSMFFVQVLSFCVTAFGGAASVATLLNCAAYLLTCTIIIRATRVRNNIVLAAIVCGPASILFSLQPLKDTLFMLLIVAMIAAFMRWERLWRAGGATTQFLLCAAAMCAVLYALGGIRWYFSVIAWGAAAIFLVLTALQVQRKTWALAANAVLLVVLAQAIRLGSPDMPPTYDRLLNPLTAVQWRPEASREHLAEVRQGFDTTPGATTIAEGDALAEPDIVPRASAAPVAASPANATRATRVASTHVTPTNEPAPNLPRRFATRMITGFAAMFLPRMIGQGLGLIHVGGGRGLWLFAETDTLVFDLVLLYAIVYCARNLRTRRLKITAAFVFGLLVFVMTAGPMLYAVNNFGTLFRLRLMAYCVMAVLPITLRDQDDAVQ